MLGMLVRLWGLRISRLGLLFRLGNTSLQMLGGLSIIRLGLR